jgi:hypothetical protein
MGLMKDNDLTDGISGRVGNKLVFRTTKGITIATRRPKPTETPVTAKQTAHRENFSADSYAKKKLLGLEASQDNRIKTVTLKSVVNSINSIAALYVDF